MRKITPHRGVLNQFVIAALALVLVGCQKNQTGAGRNAPTPSPTVAVERPVLSTRIDSISLYPVPNRAQDSAISIMVSLGNAGAPCILQDWSLEVSSPGQSVTASGPIHVNGLVDAPGKSGTKIDLDKEDLAVKTKQIPIAGNAHVNGVLTFLLKDTRENQLSHNGSSVILHFNDSAGNSYHTSPRVIGTKKEE